MYKFTTFLLQLVCKSTYGYLFSVRHFKNKLNYFSVPDCGPQQEFRYDAVIRTCMDVHADQKFRHNPTSQGDACVCEDGYVLDGDKCILESDCGCFLDGMMRKVLIVGNIIYKPCHPCQT